MMLGGCQWRNLGGAVDTMAGQCWHQHSWCWWMFIPTFITDKYIQVLHTQIWVSSHCRTHQHQQSSLGPSCQFPWFLRMYITSHGSFALLEENTTRCGAFLDFLSKPQVGLSLQHQWTNMNWFPKWTMWSSLISFEVTKFVFVVSYCCGCCGCCCCDCRS